MTQSKNLHDALAALSAAQSTRMETLGAYARALRSHAHVLIRTICRVASLIPDDPSCTAEYRVLELFWHGRNKRGDVRVSPHSKRILIRDGVAITNDRENFTIDGVPFEVFGTEYIDASSVLFPLAGRLVLESFERELPALTAACERVERDNVATLRRSARRVPQ